MLGREAFVVARQGAEFAVERGKHQVQHKQPHKTFVQLDQLATGLNRQAVRLKIFVHRGQLLSGITFICQCLLQGNLQGIEAVVGAQVRVSAARHQLLDQWRIAQTGRNHQWGQVENGAVVDPVLLGITQNTARVLQVVGQVVFLMELLNHFLFILKGRFEVVSHQLVEHGLMPMDQRVLQGEQLFFLVIAKSGLFLQRVVGCAIQHWPGHGLQLQYPAAYLIRLLLFALQLQLARLFLPLIQAGVLLFHVQVAGKAFQVQQAHQWVFQVRFDDVEVAHCPGDGHVQGVNVELVNLQRLVLLVSCPGVFQCLFFQRFRVYAGGDIAKAFLFVADEVVENDVLVLQSLGFLNREHQWCVKPLAGGRFLVRMHNQHGKAGRAGGFVVQVLLDLLAVAQ